MSRRDRKAQEDLSTIHKWSEHIAKNAMTNAIRNSGKRSQIDWRKNKYHCFFSEFRDILIYFCLDSKEEINNFVDFNDVKKELIESLSNFISDFIRRDNRSVTLDNLNHEKRLGMENEIRKVFDDCNKKAGWLIEAMESNDKSKFRLPFVKETPSKTVFSPIAFSILKTPANQKICRY